MKFISFLILCIISIVIYSAEITGKVIKIYDGDTIQILDSTGGKFKVRFADIDAPETSQEFGLDSKEFLTDLIFNKEVIVIFNSIDMYGRIVGTVYIKKIVGDTYIINVNEEMIKNGYAWWYESYSKKQELKEYELIAKQNGIGLWKNKNPKPPWVYRKEKKHAN